MDFNTFTFGELLYQLDDKVLKNKIRTIEKINRRIVHINAGINFNTICIREGLHPTFTNIYIYILKISMTYNIS